MCDSVTVATRVTVSELCQARGNSIRGSGSDCLPSLHSPVLSDCLGDLSPYQGSRFPPRPLVTLKRRGRLCSYFASSLFQWSPGAGHVCALKAPCVWKTERGLRVQMSPSSEPGSASTGETHSSVVMSWSWSSPQAPGHCRGAGQDRLCCVVGAKSRNLGHQGHREQSQP